MKDMDDEIYDDFNDERSMIESAFELTNPPVKENLSLFTLIEEQ